ncbi:MAG: hypothetical protein ACHP9Z_22970, partial [Streptosporangiales bacterium]
SGTVSAAVRGYLQQAETDYAKAQAALRADNLGQYGSELAAMKAALDKAQQAAQGTPSPSPRASPARTPAATATPSASP